MPCTCRKCEWHLALSFTSYIHEIQVFIQYVGQREKSTQRFVQWFEAGREYKSCRFRFWQLISENKTDL